jgi:hypothetical protein
MKTSPSDRSQNFTISKKFSRAINIGALVWLIVAVIAATQPPGLLIWGLASSGWPFLMAICIGLVAPLVVIYAERLYPGPRLSTFDSILRLLFALAYWSGGVFILFFREGIALDFLASLGLYVVILFTAAVRFIRIFVKATNAKRVRYTLGVLLLLAVIAVPATVFELKSRADLNELKAAVDQLASTKLAPAGAIEHVEKGRVSFYRKDGIINRADCDYVHPCPTLFREWFIPMDASRYKRMISLDSMFGSLGYRSGLHTAIDHENFWGKGRIGLRTTLNPLGKLNPPAPAPAGKTWMLLSIEGELSTYAAPSGPDETEQTALKTYTLKNQDVSFDYPQDWKVDENGNTQNDIVTIASPIGIPGKQPSGEPKASSGEVIRIVVSPCPSGRECTLDGVYDGIYKYSSWPHGDPVALDDGTLSTAFFFQYKGEEATLYTIFFRQGKKYVVSFNAAGADAPSLSLNDSSAHVYSPLVNSIRFYK